MDSAAKGRCLFMRPISHTLLETHELGSGAAGDCAVSGVGLGGTDAGHGYTPWARTRRRTNRLQLGSSGFYLGQGRAPWLWRISRMGIGNFGSIPPPL